MGPTQRKQPAPRLLEYFILPLAIAVVLVAFGGMIVFDSAVLQARGVPATATVDTVDNLRFISSAQVNYRVGDGTERTSTLWITPTDLQVGQAIPIRYDPDDPRRISQSPGTRATTYAIVMVASGGVLLILSLIGLRAHRRQRVLIGDLPYEGSVHQTEHR